MLVLELLDTTPHRLASGGDWTDAEKQAAEKEDNWEEKKRGQILRK